LPQNAVAPAAPRLAERGEASRYSVTMKAAAASTNSSRARLAAPGCVAAQRAPSVQTMTAVTMPAVRTRQTADGVTHGSG
jgi:hypothetical protein